MKIDYTKYTVEELIHDDFFIQSAKHPTNKSNIFWNKVIETDPKFESKYLIAKNVIISIQVSKEQMNNEELNSLWHLIDNKSINNKKLSITYTLFRYAAAVCFLAIITTSIYFLLKDSPKLSNNTEDTFVMIDDSIVQDEIILVLGNQKEIIDSKKEVHISHSSEGEIQIDGTTIKKNIPDTKTSYNQLIVPYGKRAELTLSDGTTLWVNAGTKVVYPTEFNNKREINVLGEVFLEVTASQKPFIVKTPDFSVEVLGTSFNVMAYQGKDLEQTVALLNGSVKIKSLGSDIMLKPHELFTKKEDSQKVEKTNIYNHISWKDGVYVFNHQNLSSIMKRISRYYGVKIKCDDKSSSLICSGKLDMKDNLERVLNGISKTVEVAWNLENEEYQIYSNN